MGALGEAGSLGTCWTLSSLLSPGQLEPAFWGGTEDSPLSPPGFFGSGKGLVLKASHAPTPVHHDALTSSVCAQARRLPLTRSAPRSQCERGNQGGGVRRRCGGAPQALRGPGLGRACHRLRPGPGSRLCVSGAPVETGGSGTRERRAEAGRSLPMGVDGGRDSWATRLAGQTAGPGAAWPAGAGKKESRVRG